MIMLLLTRILLIIKLNASNGMLLIMNPNPYRWKTTRQKETAYNYL